MKVLVTGGTNGMGLGVARALAARPDTHVVVLGRSAERGQATIDALRALGSPAAASFVCCDLSRLADVRSAIDAIRRDHDHLDALLVNAGIGYAPARVVTEDGLDAHFQVNYLAHFMLTLGLLELLERSEHGGRVVLNATEFGAVGFDDLQLARSWSYEAAIFQAMAAKRLFYAKLHRLYEAAPERPFVSCFGFRIHKTVWTHQLALIPWHMRAMATVARWLGQFISIDECGAVMAPLLVEAREASRARSGRLVTFQAGSLRDFDGAPPTDAAREDELWDASLALCDDDRTRRIARALAIPGRGP